jgi:exosortase K
VSWLARERWRVATVLVALAVVVIGKQLYRDATPADLRWILAPTAQLVSWITGHAFVYEAGQGWINTDVMFVIAPACAGVNFALAAFLALALGGLADATTWQAATRRLAAAAALAYLATIVVNTARISIAVDMHRADLHRIEGIVVYLGGLLGVFAIARALDGRRLRALHWLAIPLGAYVLITLVMPAANGAAHRADFAQHAATVLAACIAVVVVASLVTIIRNSRRTA